MLERERERFHDPPDPSAYARFCPAPPALAAIATAIDAPEVRDELARCEEEARYPRAALDAARAAGLSALLATARAHELCALNALCAERDASLAITCGVNALALLPVLAGGSPEQRERVLARVAEGAFASLLLTEAEHGSNLLRIEASAEPGVLVGGAFRPLAGDEEPTHYRLRGEKHFINGAREHELLVALLRTRPAAQDASPLRARGDLSVFWLERDASVVPLRRWRTLPARAADISGLRFEGTLVPAAQRLGPEGSGFGLIRKTLTVSRGGIAALAAGIAARARGLAGSYAARRNLYGAPIRDLGAIAEHLLRLEVAERLAAAVAVRASWAINAQGLGAAATTAIAKFAACELAEEAVDQGARVLGGRALLEELPYARLLRDVRLYGVFDGTRHVMLAELEGRLADEVYRWMRAEGGDDPLAASIAIYGAPGRSLVGALAAGARPSAPLLPERVAALASLAPEEGVPLGPLPAVVEALYALVRAAREAGRWDDDQAARFAAAEVFARLAALAALIELGDPARRTALGVGPLDRPEEERPFVRLAVAWHGADALARLQVLAARLGLAEWEPPSLRKAGGLAGALETLLREEPAARAAARARLATRN